MSKPIFKEQRDELGRPLRSIAQLKDLSVPFNEYASYGIDYEGGGVYEEAFVREWSEAHNKRLLLAYSPAAYRYFEDHLDLANRNINVQMDRLPVSEHQLENMLVVLMDKDLKNPTVFTKHQDARKIYLLAYHGYRKRPITYGAKQEVPRIVGVHLIDSVLFIEKQTRKSTCDSLLNSRLAAHSAVERRRKLQLLLL